MAEISKKIIRKHLSLENAPENTRLSQGNDVWIPAEEKPTKDGFYQATISGTLAGVEEPFVGLAQFKGGEWLDRDYVIAWRPFPDPYRPSDKMESIPNSKEKEKGRIQRVLFEKE